MAGIYSNYSGLVSTAILPIYPLAANLPSVSIDGATAIALDTHDVYVYNAGTPGWAAVGSSGFVSGPGSSTDSQIALFSGTSGTVLKAAVGTGLAQVVSGALSVNNSVSFALTSTYTGPNWTFVGGGGGAGQINWTNNASSGFFNWRTGAQLSASNFFEICPSTLADGIIFTTPVFGCASSGAVQIGPTSGTPTHVLNSATAAPAAGALTLTNGPTGKSGNPAGYLSISINGSTRVIPFW